MAQPPTPPKKAVSYRLTADALELIDALARRLGITHVAVVELSVREKAEALGLWPPPATDRSDTT
jgi:hypothetical protein